MRRARPLPIRNTLDLSDRVQVRLVRKRLRLSDTQLVEIVDRIGNSISAIGKEVALRRAAHLPLHPIVEIPPAAVIASTVETCQAENELNEQAP